MKKEKVRQLFSDSQDHLYCWHVSPHEILCWRSVGIALAQHSPSGSTALDTSKGLAHKTTVMVQCKGVHCNPRTLCNFHVGTGPWLDPFFTHFGAHHTVTLLEANTQWALRNFNEWTNYDNSYHPEKCCGVWKTQIIQFNPFTQEDWTITFGENSLVKCVPFISIQIILYKQAREQPDQLHALLSPGRA